MISRNVFLHSEIPFEQLAMLGISKDAYLNFPNEIVKQLAQGNVTPLIEAKISTADGRSLTLPVKLQLVRQNGKVELLTYPVRRKAENTFRLSDDDFQKLKDLKVVRREMKESGSRKTKFLQLDPETNATIVRNSIDLRLANKMKEIETIKDIQLGSNQKQAILEGKPVELNVGDEKVTVGVDLRQPDGFKIVNGDMNEWEKQQKINYDLANEGYMGYVQTDENRWQYQQVVNQLEFGKEGQAIKQEQTMKRGLK